MSGLWGLTISSGRGATLKYLKDGLKSKKDKMAASLGRKVIISASKALSKGRRQNLPLKAAEGP